MKREAVIVDVLRTTFGKRGGALANWHPADLLGFALTNLLGGLGSDFHASPHFVGAVGGAGVLFAGIAGCLVFPLIDRLLPLRYLYLTIGVVGALFTLSLLLLPRTPLAFATALIDAVAAQNPSKP